MKKFSKFLHKALENQPAPDIKSALMVTEALYDAWRHPGTPMDVGLSIDHGLRKYFDPGTDEHSDINDAFAQSHRVETHIQPQSSCYVSSRYNIEAHIRFYRAGETIPIYQLSAGLAEGKLIFQTREALGNFIWTRLVVDIGLLTSPRQVPLQIQHTLDIGVSCDEILRLRYGGTLNDPPPRGGDYFHVVHFVGKREVSSVKIMASPCYEYVVDIGHGLVLYPDGDGFLKNLPLQATIHRCQKWAVQKFNPAEWSKDVPIKTLQELIPTKKAVRQP